MDNFLQTTDLPREIQELLKAIEVQHRLMLEMRANLQRLELDLALARQTQDEHGKHLEEHPAHTD